MKNKRLDILVIHYKEPEEVVKPLLDSIALQQGVDMDKVGVIIVNDGDDVLLSDEFLSGYKFDIKYVINKHKGICGTRNRALDESEAEYVMFCDCDDMFLNSIAFNILKKHMNKIDEFGNIGFDVLISRFKEECMTDLKESVFMDHFKEDNTFVHGKVYRRNYLVQNNIRWNEDVITHEDLVFNVVAICSTERVKRIDDVLYLWKYNKGSITRRDEDFVFATADKLIDSYYELIKDLMERGLIRNAKANTANIIYRMYYEMNKKIWLDRPERSEEIKKYMKEKLGKYIGLFEKASDEDKIKLLKEITGIFFAEKYLYLKYGFDEWFKEVFE